MAAKKKTTKKSPKAKTTKTKAMAKKK